MSSRKSFFRGALGGMLILTALGSVGLGCADTDTAQTTTFTFAGVSRSFTFLVPDSYTGETAVPLVVVLHGKDQDVDDIRFITNFDDVAQREGFIVAYPAAYQGEWNDGRFDDETDDVGFISEVAAQLVANFNVDREQLYICGFSNGALMTHRMAFQAADVFAAFGAVASAIPENLPLNATPTGPVNMCMMHGTDDEIIPWEGGNPFPDDFQGIILSIPDSVNYWVENNGCIDEPVVRELPNRESNDRTQVTEYTYNSCNDGTEVVFYEIEDGGHAWPGAPASQALFTQGNISRDIDGAETLWGFFEDKTNPL